MIKAITTALTGLNASTKKVENSASNIANSSSAGSLDPEHAKQPYSNQITTQETNKTGGVTVNTTTKDPGFIPSYSPDSPFADKNGLIGVPNTDLTEEIVNIKMAELNYKANLKVIQTASQMQNDLIKSLDKKV